MIKDPNESNLREEEFIWLAIPGKGEVGWQQQALEGAGHHVSTLKKQRAVNAFFRVLGLLSQFGQSRVTAREWYHPQ